MALAEQEDGGTGDGSADVQGLSLKGSGGYRYFGAAKNLPGVRELFARHAAKLTKRKRGDVYKYITPDYYGLRDEEDGVLLELESDTAVHYLRQCTEIRTTNILGKLDEQHHETLQRRSNLLHCNWKVIGL